jgi:hypothetical protein
LFWAPKNIVLAINFYFYFKRKILKEEEIEVGSLAINGWFGRFATLRA